MSIIQRCRAENTFNLVSMSGGKDSLAQCLYAIENDIQHERVFADTGHEHHKRWSTLTTWNKSWAQFAA